MICFVGSSFAALTLKEGARRRGLEITEDAREASLIFISEDTPTDEHGKRDLEKISHLIDKHPYPIVLTSQVPPGFCRSLRYPVYYQAETLRIEDALQRALHPEMFIVGYRDADFKLPRAYQEYLEAFDCPILKMSYEDAEFAKIAINATLISQVETTNMLARHAEKCGADWVKVARALRHDSRIGKYAYLTPGAWQPSRHLMRDFATLNEIEPDKLLEAWR